MKHTPGFTPIRLLCISSLLLCSFWVAGYAQYRSNRAFLVSSQAFLPPCTPPTGLIISEFRLRVPGGVNDEFIELYNNTNAALTVCTADGSSGWAVVSADGTVRFVTPSDTTIPARAHLLATSSGYSLNSYAVGDLTVWCRDLVILLIWRCPPAATPFRSESLISGGDRHEMSSLSVGPFGEVSQVPHSSDRNRFF